MLSDSSLVNSCPLCESNRIIYDFVVNTNPVCYCKDCLHLFVNPQPEKESFVNNENLIVPEKFNRMIRTELNSRAKQSSNALEIGTPLLGIDNLEIKNIISFDIYRFLEEESVDVIEYDLCVINNVLDYAKSPYKLLQKIYTSLKNNGLLFFYIPTLDSKNAKQKKHNWSVFSGNRLHFFNTATIQNILCKCGYEHIRIIPVDDNGVFISCRKCLLRSERIISIIVPVYNEEKTVGILLDRIINKQLEGLKKEIIIVESNSKDSTRQIVIDFVQKHPEVKLVLEDKPSGKGHAVRSGFKEATGDFIAIQDGDLEYDINDFDQLVNPLKNYQKAFILGSRHTGDWKIRSFGESKKIIAAYVNFGHILLSGLINIGCGVNLKDPFTMYKLFRRECLYGLKFDGNRFEIDWEIVIKLIRKGYIPEEIPINYQARGFNEGKKIALLKDPIICVLCFFKYRYFYKLIQDGNGVQE